MYQFESGDYIVFKRIIQPERKVSHRSNGTARAVVVPAVPEQVLPQRGDGQIIKLAKTPRRVKVGISKIGTPIYETYSVARVAAGSQLGVVTAILDDAELAAKPLTMDLGIDATDPAESRPSMYGDAKDHA